MKVGSAKVKEDAAGALDPLQTPSGPPLDPLRLLKVGSAKVKEDAAGALGALAARELDYTGRHAQGTLDAQGGLNGQGALAYDERLSNAVKPLVALLVSPPAWCVNGGSRLVRESPQQTPQTSADPCSKRLLCNCCGGQKKKKKPKT